MPLSAVVPKLTTVGGVLSLKGKPLKGTGLALSENCIFSTPTKRVLLPAPSRTIIIDGLLMSAKKLYEARAFAKMATSVPAPPVRVSCPKVA